jgi:hypothetical protein
MQMRSLLRKIASLLLLVCFVLPLSKCTTQVMKDGRGVMRDGVPVMEDSYTYPYALARHSIDYAADGQLGDASITLFAVLTVFFLPLALLRLGETAQSLATCVLSVPAAYFLYGWVFFMSSGAQIGGLLAIACWTVLLLLSVAQLAARWRARRTARAAITP